MASLLGLALLAGSPVLGEASSASSPASSLAASLTLGIVDVSAAAPAGQDWAEIFAVRAELGDHRLLVEYDATATRAARELGLPLRSLEAVPADAPLYRVVGAGAVESAMLPGMGRILWRDDDPLRAQLLVLPHAERDLRALAGKGVNLYRVADTAAVPVRTEALELIASRAAPEYAEIDEIVAAITGANVQGYVEDMVAFGTRHSDLPGGANAQAWLKSTFESFGYTQVAELPVPNIGADNVCATLPGTVTPETVFVVGGHYDSTATNTSNAPGADDNASGTAGVLEIARVLAGYSFESTLVFCGYAGEELGLLGSAEHARALNAAGVQVGAMINLDMIGHLAAGDAVDIDVASNGASSTLRALVADVVARYVPDAQQVDGQLPAGASSDHASFQQRGFPAVMLFEDTGDYSPFIHTANDTVGNSFNSAALAEKITRGAAATLAALALPATAGPGPTPTPTPDPNDPGDPSDPADGMETVHGGCACDLGLAPTTTPLALPLALSLLALAGTVSRRRR